MPYAIDLPIAGRGEPPRDVYRALHATLLKWIAAADSELATAVHDRPARKPFTVAPLTPNPDGGWRWRITLLVDALWPALLEGGQQTGALDLDGRAFPVAFEKAQTLHRSYDALLTEIQPDTYLRLAFLSPTTFRAGRLDMPLPEPGAVFQSWLSRWNDFAPPNRAISTALIDVIREHIAIAEIKALHTERHDLGRSRPVGFVGYVTYVITGARKLNQADVWRINALADYAEFCGTGRKTTQGMGQTRRTR